MCTAVAATVSPVMLMVRMDNVGWGQKEVKTNELRNRWVADGDEHSPTLHLETIILEVDGFFFFPKVVGVLFVVFFFYCLPWMMTRP